MEIEFNAMEPAALLSVKNLDSVQEDHLMIESAGSAPGIDAEPVCSEKEEIHVEPDCHDHAMDVEPTVIDQRVDVEPACDNPHIEINENSADVGHQEDTAVTDNIAIPTAADAPCVPAWKSDLSFWLMNKVFIEYYSTKSDCTVLERIPIPHQRFFGVSQVEVQLACGNRELAEAMIKVISAPGQLPCNDAVRHCRRFNKLVRRLASPSDADLMNAEMEAPVLELPAEPKPGHFSGSDSDADETGSRLAMEVEEASRRHSIILGLDPPRLSTPLAHSAQKAVRILMEDEQLMASVRKRLEFGHERLPATEGKKRTAHVDLTHEELEDSGSTVRYALLTPSKRIKALLQADQVISPVRRSQRPQSEAQHGPEVFEDLTAAVHAATEDETVGFLPNGSLPGTPTKRKL